MEVFVFLYFLNDDHFAVGASHDNVFRSLAFIVTYGASKDVEALLAHYSVLFLIVQYGVVNLFLVRVIVVRRLVLDDDSAM